MNLTEFREKAINYGRAHRMLPWMIGDLLNEFVEARGEEAFQYVDAFGLSDDVLRDYMRVAEVFDGNSRYDYKLSIWYFREVASLPGVYAHVLLREAIKHGWTSKELRAEARKQRAKLV